MSEAQSNKRYELWYSEEGGYTFLEEGNEQVRRQLEGDAKLIWVVEASSWDEAQTKKHEYLGWEPYKPMT